MDLAAIAFNIIHNVIKVKQNMTINLSAELHNGYDLDDPLVEIPLLEEFALVVRKIQAFPILDIASENLRKRVFSELSLNELNMPNQYYEKWVSLADIFIDFSWKSNPYFMDDMPLYYLSRYNISANELWHQIRKQSKKVVLMGLPTNALATYYNLDYQALNNSYLKAINIDYHELKKQSLIAENKFKKHDKCNLITEDRNLEVKFTITDTQMYNGDFGSRCFMVLPTGRIEKKIDSLDGIFYADKVYLDTKSYSDVQIIFEKGKIIATDFLNQNDDNIFLNKLLMNSLQEAYLTVGLNPALTKNTGYLLFDECMLNNCCIRLQINNKTISLANSKTKLYQHNINILESET